MKVDLATLPTDVDALHGLVHVLVSELKARELRVEQLEARIARLQRLQFGRSSEKRTQEIEQLQLALDDLHEETGAAAAERPAALRQVMGKPVRRPLPDHLPREEIVHAPACACPQCGGVLRRLGEEVTEVLDYVPASFKVIRHVRPKFSCRTCEAITVAPMPSLPIERGRPGAGLLAHVLVSKYADHLPLYRQRRDLCARGRGAGSLDPGRLGGSVDGTHTAPDRGAAPGGDVLGGSYTPTTRRCRCWLPAWAGRRRAGCGLMSATSARTAARPRRRRRSSTHPTARGRPRRRT